MSQAPKLRVQETISAKTVKEAIKSVVIVVSSAKNKCRGTWILSGREQGERTEPSANCTVVEAHIGIRFDLSLSKTHIILA
jgi:hypothetical protein